MSMFEADLEAFGDWWRTGDTKPRRQSTLDEYARQVRHWRTWESKRNPNPPSAPPAPRPPPSPGWATSRRRDNAGGRGG